MCANNVLVRNVRLKKGATYVVLTFFDASLGKVMSHEPK